MSRKSIAAVIAVISTFMLVTIIFWKSGFLSSLAGRTNRGQMFTESEGIDQFGMGPFFQFRTVINKGNFKRGDKIEIGVDLEFNIDVSPEYLDYIKGIYAALSAERIFDADGNPHRFSNEGMSTLLTPTGLPIENMSFGIPHSKLDTIYIGEYELYAEKPLAPGTKATDLKHFHMDVKGVIPEDLPDGYYRFEIEIGALTKENVPVRLEEYPFLLKMIKARNTKDMESPVLIGMYINALRGHHYSPIFMIGKPAQPHMIWTLLGGEYGYEARGIIAEEDKNRFAMNLNGTGPAIPIYPMRNSDGSYRMYNLEPDFPQENVASLLFQDYAFPKDTLNTMYSLQCPVTVEPIPFDYTSGRLRVVVHTPTGAITELGEAPFFQKTETGATTGSGEFRYVFKEYGEYTIESGGWIKDIWGHKYEGGGTYKIWIAEPLSFSTSTKPGMPFPVGASFSTRVSVHPGVPADIDIKVWLYRDSKRDDVKAMHFSGKANSYGYHFAVPIEKLTFDASGEYYSEITAKYIDGAGRLWMGAAVNSSIIYDPKTQIKLHGDPSDYILTNHYNTPRFHMKREFIDSWQVDTECYNFSRYFPYDSRDILKVALPRLGKDVDIRMRMTFEDPTGFWEKKVYKSFPSTDDLLAKKCPSAMEIIKRNYSWYEFMPINMPDCMLNNFMNIGAVHKQREYMPLMMLSDKLIQPYDYPEKINSKCYYYVSALKPGMLIRRLVCDSTIQQAYWQPFPSSFNHRLGFLANGDMPTEQYRLVAGAIFNDLKTGKYDTAPYHGSMVFTDYGYNDDRIVAPFEEPLVEVAGRKMFAILGASPEPGTIYQTGDLVSNGGITFPATAMDFIWNVKFPDGTELAQQGRSNDFGLAFPPKPVFPADMPGVYRVTQKLGTNGELGGIVGTGDDSFNIYVVQKDSPYKITFTGPPVVPITDPAVGVTLLGKIPSEVQKPQLYYTVITPGCVLAEGTLPVDGDGSFSYQFIPLNQNQHCPNYSVALGDTGVPSLTNMVMFSFFLQGVDAQGKLVTAGRQAFIVRDRLITIDLPSIKPEHLAHFYTSEERPDLTMMAHPDMVEFYYPGQEGKAKIASLNEKFNSFTNSLFKRKENQFKSKDDLVGFCGACHTNEDVLALGLDRGEWRRVLNFHWKKDPLLFNNSEYEAALEMLQTEFGSFWPKSGAEKSQLMAGEEIYKKNCVTCHDEGRVFKGSKYSSGWKNLVWSMSGLMDSPMSEADQASLTKYLSWRQSREIDMSDIPAPGQETKWQKPRAEYQRVCFTCHALPYMTGRPWPENSSTFVMDHIKEKGPHIATPAQLNEISKYLDYRKYAH